MESRSEAVFTYSKGLDKASKPFEADPSRALDELNYVYRDGKVQKRHGLNELLTVKPTEYIKVGFDGTEATSASTNAVEWNGIWRFKAEDRKYHVVAHIGKLMYEVYEENGSFKCEPITSGTGISSRSRSQYPKCYEFEDYRSVAVVAANSLYFFGGNMLLDLFNVDINSFAVAGAFILFLMALEMVLDVDIFKYQGPTQEATLIPFVFPLIAGPAVFTTLLSLGSSFAGINIILALFLNLVCVYFVLSMTSRIERFLGRGGIYIIRKFFGIILLAVSVGMFIDNITKLVNRISA